MKSKIKKNSFGLNFLQFAFIVSVICLLTTQDFAQNTPTHQNGDTIVYNSIPQPQIFSVKTDGSNRTQLTPYSCAGCDNDVPYFSWDGSKIYYFGYPEDDSAGGEIFSMGANGSNITRLSYNVRQLINPPYNNGTDRRPAVSPDGTKFVYECDGLGTVNNGRICVGSASGYTGNTNQRITPTSHFALRPSYSPDGNKIVFQGKPNPCSGCNYYNIYTTNADGSGTPTALTSSNSSSEYNYYPRFSPDGNKIVFTRCAAGDVENSFTCEIWIMNADGGNQTRLTTSGGNIEASWSPDGTKIAYVNHSLQPAYELYVMDANGANQTRITNGGANEFNEEVHNPTWGAAAYVSVAPTQNVNLQFSNVTSSGDTSAAPINPNDTASAPPNYGFPANAPAYDITTTAAYSGTIDVILQVPNVGSPTACANLRILHFTGGAWTDANNAAPQYDAATMVCTLRQTVTSLSPFAVAQVLGPTAATVTVSGQVLSGKRGIRNAFVTLTEQDGATRTILTGTSGIYQFTDIAAGQTVIVSVRAKRFTFSQPTQIISLNENFAALNFYADNNQFVFW